MIHENRHVKAVADPQNEFVGGLTAGNGLIHRRGQEGGQGHGQNVDDHAADDLIGPEAHAQKRMEAGIDAAADEGRQHGDIDHRLRAVSHNAHQKHGHQSADKGAEALKALNSQVGHAAFFRVDGADRHDQQRRGKGQAINKNLIQHDASSFPAPAACADAFASCAASSAIRSTRRWARYWKYAPQAENSSRIPVIREAISLATPRVELM